MKHKLFAGLALAALGMVGSPISIPAQSHYSLSNVGAAAMAHIQELCALGIREPGSPVEAKALALVDREFQKAGLKTRVEPFSFLTYSPGRMRLRVGDREAEPEMASFDVYGSPKGVSGPVVFVDPQTPRESLIKMDLAGKIAVSAKPANPFVFYRLKPKAAVFLKTEDFQALKAAPETTAALEAEGKVETKRSANLIAVLPASSSPYKKRILVSAHYDAVAGPGASDNASGVAVMLEIARYFASMKQEPVCEIDFVAFGAEEAALLGSRVFVSRHGKALADVELVFNMDTVGAGDFYIEMQGGISGISARKGESQIPPDLANKAAADATGRWQWLEPRLEPVMSASCVPEWLKEKITGAAAELGIAFTPSNYMGSDNLVFAQAGIPTTNIAAGGSRTHSPEDTPDKIVLRNLEDTAALVIRVIDKTMERVSEGR